jgi:starch synthase
MQPMTGRMRVLFVTPEIAPWVKAGGLGDVAEGLPSALARAGLDVRILVPGYRNLLSAFPDAPRVASFQAWGGMLAPAHLREARGKVRIYLVDCPEYFDREGTAYQSPQGFDWPDNYLRFGLLGRAAAALASDESPLDWRPEILHCNDWQAGLAPAYLSFATGPTAATVQTIHNLAYQGLFPPSTLRDLALPDRAYAMDGVEFHGYLSFLKAGLFYATKITTVSPTYAAQILTAPLGFGLDGLLRYRAADLTGILNGIDTEVWDPTQDPHLVRTYASTSLQRKAENKAALQRHFGLLEEPRSPLLGLVSRLVEQKGIDLVVAAADRLVKRGCQVVVLGSGQRDSELALLALVEQFRGQIGVHIGYSEPLAHQVEGGADLFLMPSRFEPCGLNQMISMRYGTPPVVHRTGGLADSVVDATPATLEAGTATGIVFDTPTPEALLAAVDRGLTLYRSASAWRRLQECAMARDASWSESAPKYLEVYQAAVSAAGKIAEG